MILDFLASLIQASPFRLSLLVFMLVLLLAFELWMLIDALAFRKMPVSHRVWWVVGMFLIHPFVAMVYLFARNNYKRVA